MNKTTTLSKAEKLTLIKLALDSISTYLETHQLPEYQPQFPSFSKPAAVFVTLTIHGRLRGCVGQIIADKPLYAAVQDAALSAAFSDPRFPALSKSELKQLHIKIAVLSPFIPIAPEDIQIGRHGLMIEHNFRRGLLLPEVAEERGWDSTTFLQNLCYKANLPPDAWNHAEKILGFTTTVIEIAED